MALTEGQVVHNRYQIESLLGRGGMGAVYRARDIALEIPVAIKENAMATPESARQFQREARMMARLRHSNLPRVTDHFVSPAGAQYLVMDFVEGEGGPCTVAPAERAAPRGAGAGLDKGGV